jgi:redox-regulated HSP33 family molecular chaperone
MSTTPKDDQGQAFADRPVAITAEVVLRRQKLQREREAQRLARPTQYMDPAPEVTVDTLWRGLSRNGEVRLLVVRAAKTVDEAARRLQCSPDVTQALGELMVATLLVRSTLNPDDQLQVTLDHQGPVGRVTVDAWREGGMRAYVAHPQEEKEAFGFLIGAGTLQVSRSAAVGAPGTRNYSSTTTLDGNNVADYFMNYLLDSEQILSLLQTDVVVAADGTVQHAVGYLVQLMPEGKRGDIQTILGNLGPLPPLHQAMKASDPDGRAWAARAGLGSMCARGRGFSVPLQPPSHVVDAVDAAQARSARPGFWQRAPRIAL